MALTTDTADLTGRLNLAMGTAIASATTPNINSATGNTVRVTGTTTITGFSVATQAGIKRTLIFNDALILTNGANLVLFGDANITTIAGDIVEFIAETTTLWRMISFFRPTGYTNGQLDADALLNSSVTAAKIGDAAIIPSKLPTRAVAALTDADQNILSEQIITSGILTCTPTAARIKTLPTALAIIALLPGYQVGTRFEFTLLSLAAFNVTLATNTGITLIGGLVANNSSATFMGVVDSSTTVSIYRK